MTPSTNFALSPEGALDQGRRLYERTTGIPPSEVVLNAMAQKILEGKTDEAAFEAMNHIKFYQSTLTHMFNPLSNPDRSSDLPLNDFSATVVGIVYNNEAFDQALYGDFFYKGEDALSVYDINGGPVNLNGDPDIRIDNGTPPSGFIRPIFRRGGNDTDIRYDTNQHYADLEKIPNWPTRLVKRSQVSMHAKLRTDERYNVEDVMGLMTTRQAGLSYFNAGTNRRPLRFAFKYFLGYDLEQLHDASRPDVRVRREVDRSPGGNSLTYQQECRGCHAGMDALAGAFAYYDFNNDRNAYNRSALQGAPNGNKQYRQNNVYPQGYLLVDNTWVNLWVDGPNAKLGWRVPAGMSNVNSGTGARSLGMMLAATEAFSENMASIVFNRICLREPTPAEATSLKSVARDFENGFSNYSAFQAAGAYNFRALWARVSTMCFGN